MSAMARQRSHSERARYGWRTARTAPSRESTRRATRSRRHFLSGPSPRPSPPARERYGSRTAATGRSHGSTPALGESPRRSRSAAAPAHWRSQTDRCGRQRLPRPRATVAERCGSSGRRTTGASHAAARTRCCTSTSRAGGWQRWPTMGSSRIDGLAALEVGGSWATLPPRSPSRAPTEGRTCSSSDAASASPTAPPSGRRTSATRWSGSCASTSVRSPHPTSTVFSGPADAGPSRVAVTSPRGSRLIPKARTITIHLRAPDAEFLHELTLPTASVVPRDSPMRLVRRTASRHRAVPHRAFRRAARRAPGTQPSLPALVAGRAAGRLRR